MENICHFIPYHKDYHSIHTINFVLENKQLPLTTLKSEAVYKMHYVTKGTGFLHVLGKILPLTEGDIFFTFPSIPFCIESVDSFSFMYISFVGSRGNMIMEKLGISPQNFIFNECNEMYEFWKRGIDTSSELMDLVSESVLLYTFSFLSNKLLHRNTSDKKEKTVSLTVKKYIDDHFTESDLSLDTISKEIRYNSKYISTSFKKYFGVGIAEYLNTIRIQHSCTLIQQGVTSIKNISYLCGYSDPHYFAVVFRKKMGMSPSAYIKENTPANDANT